MIKYNIQDVKTILDVLIENFADKNVDWYEIKEARKEIKKCIDLIYKYHLEELNKKKWIIKDERNKR